MRSIASGSNTSRVMIRPSGSPAAPSTTALARPSPKSSIDAASPVRTGADRARRARHPRRGVAQCCSRHRVVPVTANAVDTGDVPKKLAGGERPWFGRVHGHVALDRRVEIETSFLGQPRDGRGHDRLRQGAQAIPRRWRYRRSPIDIGPSKAFGPDDVAVHGDRH